MLSSSSEVKAPSAQKLKTIEALHSLLPKISLLPAINRSSTNSEAVKILQNSLRLLGYFFDSADGSYGEISREALMYFQLEAGVIQSPQDPGAGVFGEKTKAALDQALTQKVRMLEAGKQFPPSSLAGLSFEEERRLARHSIYQEINHSHNVQNRTYPGRLQDHEILLESILGRTPGDENTKALKDVLIRPEMDRLLFIDIGPGIANKDLDVRNGRGKPAISLQEVAQKFTGIQCVALDLPSEVDIFTGKTPAVQAGYSIHPDDRNALLAKQNMHLISGNGLHSLRQQLENPATNPYPNRPRPTPTKNSTIVVRAANSIDLYANWEQQMKPALAKMAEDFRDNPVMLLFNREILVKPAHSTTWKLVGQVSGMGFRHNDRALTRSGHPPFFLYENKVRSLKAAPPLDNVSQIPAGTEEGARGQHVRLLQTALRDLGYFKADITGQFGSRTKESLIRFQLAHRVIDSREARGAGVFGPKTKAELLICLIEKKEKGGEGSQRAIDPTINQTKARLYMNQHAPEYAHLLKGSTLHSIAPLEETINSIHGMNDLGKIARKREKMSAAEVEIITQRRQADQVEYLNILVKKYNVAQLKKDLRSKDEKIKNGAQVAMASLYRINGGTKNYIDELEDLNRQIGRAMGPNIKMSIVLPAYNEEKNIRNTLSDWISQVGPKGEVLRPDEVEIIILINKPTSKAVFDNTAEEIEKFKRDYPAYRNSIHYVKKTFNSIPAVEGGPETVPVHVDGVSIPVPTGKPMGIIYKMCGDLALLRNRSRDVSQGPRVAQERIANHLIRTGGSDAYGRNPTLLSQVIPTFDAYPELDQFKSESEFPPDVLMKIPLLHITERFRQSLNRLYTQNTSAFGLGTYRAALYAEVGGFNMALGIKEEIDLAGRMKRETGKKRHPVVYKGTTLNALDDPRRVLQAMFKGKATAGAYNKFHTEEVTDVQVGTIDEKRMPEETKLTGQNLELQLTAYLNQNIRLAYKNGKTVKNNFDASFEIIKKYATISLLAMGFAIDDFEIRKGGGIDDPQGPGKVVIKNLSNIQVELGKYKNTSKPAWMMKRRLSLE